MCHSAVQKSRLCNIFFHVWAKVKIHKRRYDVRYTRYDKFQQVFALDHS